MSVEENLKDRWYAGRFLRRQGSYGNIDVLATRGTEGWETLDNRDQAFPKIGQVEVAGFLALSLHIGEWVAFQKIKNARPRAVPFAVGKHHRLPRYLDLKHLESIEAARYALCTEGLSGVEQVGRWAVRFTSERFILIEVAREKRDKVLRVAPKTLSQINCYPFDPTLVMEEPASLSSSQLYDFSEIVPVETFDWSPDSDYIARVIRSLSGESDRRLADIIAWLELHAEQRSGIVSATGTSGDAPYEALRSGLLVKRLKDDKALMSTYIHAVQDDPAVKLIVADAAARMAKSDRATIAIEVEASFADEYRNKGAIQDAILFEKLQAFEQGLSLREKGHEEQLALQLAEAAVGIEQQAQRQAEPLIKKLREEVEKLQADRDELLRRSDDLRAVHAQISLESEQLDQSRRSTLDEVAHLAATKVLLTHQPAQSNRKLVCLPKSENRLGAALPLQDFVSTVTKTILLTDAGKNLMIQFATLMLAGEIPLLVGDEANDFSLVAGALVASGRLLPFDLDSTILTPEDIWSRPGSGIDSHVAEASQRADLNKETFLIHLRGVDRSAARSWYPALASLSQRGLLPRRLLMFATLMDPESEEAQAIPADIGRLSIIKAINPASRMFAPTLLGQGSSAIAFDLDPGERARDLSPGNPIIAKLAGEIPLTTSLRLTRIAVEALKLRPGDNQAASAAVASYYRSIQAQ